MRVDRPALPCRHMDDIRARSTSPTAGQPNSYSSTLTICIQLENLRTVLCAPTRMQPMQRCMRRAVHGCQSNSAPIQRLDGSIQHPVVGGTDPVPDVGVA